ncbi:chaperone DnaJ domain-containing protein [Psychromonas sp. CNPT3]|uniref:DnaJ C-terminal domain-containing protein n=1 Tax=Psychromonas sp. CNPT3 TaxID=314282 RepID=UPI00006E53A3|nr:DnaJ C-terminal domain-containing protein [Psychromonas sp. CNPT3]AGH81104.1 chaperone DnaJ domain-containing protein [Psychromonas sp. CNPT3]
MAKRDHYEVLGINKSATDKEIKRAYKKLAMKFHPDRNPGNPVAEENFREVKSAYEILHDEDKRDQYDHYGHAAFDGQGGGRGQGFGGSSRGFEDIFGSMYEQREQPRYQPQPEVGSDIILSLEISLEQAINGCEQEVKLPNNPEPLLVTVPAGVAHGQHVKVQGKGNPGTLGAARGNLLVQVTLLEDDVFRREGLDLYCFITPSFPLAALGGTLKVPTFTGFINIKIPAGTQVGRKFRIKGKGIKAMQTTEVGDLIYEVQIKTPLSLSAEQETLLKALAEIL